jgi:hypothetical protein
MTFASVVSCDIVRLAFLIAALNDLEMLSANISGTYLNANAGEKVYLLRARSLDPTRRVAWL